MSANLNIVSDIKNFINQVASDKELLKCFSCSPSAFTRKRELDFERVVLMLLNFFKRSYSVEIADFYHIVGQQELSVSKSAFCQQRQKIDCLFFYCLHLMLVNSFYTHYQQKIKRWQGLRLIAVDGSTSYLLNKEEIVNYFGTHGNQRGKVPMARVLTAYDVLNEITINAGIYPIADSEQKLALSWLNSYEEDMLLIYDRGYPGFASIFHHQEQERPQPFLMRCALGFNAVVKDFVASPARELVTTFQVDKPTRRELFSQGFILPKGSTVQVRLIKIKLDNGLIEVLATNLFDTEKYPYQMFKKLYSLRWEIETRYNCLKNKLQMELYSGHKVGNLKQDFYISIFLANLQAILSKPPQEYLEKAFDKRKYKYSINENVTIGILKNRIITLFLHQQPDEILRQLEDLIIKHSEPVRPNRNVPRIKHFKRRAGKYQALSNYKRAF